MATIQVVLVPQTQTKECASSHGLRHVSLDCPTRKIISFVEEDDDEEEESPFWMRNQAKRLCMLRKNIC